MLEGIGDAPSAGFHRTCAGCHSPFIASTRRRRFCSRDCYHASTVRHPTVTCAQCATPFRVSRSNPIYCSVACRFEAIKQRHLRPCAQCGAPLSTARGHRNERFCSVACYRRFRGETLLEREVRQALTALGVPFIAEYPVGGWSIDFALTTKGIALEVDGAYWHRDPERDSRRDQGLAERGWHVLRLGEREIKAAPDVVALLERRLENTRDHDLRR
jgi:very-short-patch-repair endonuclease